LLKFRQTASIVAVLTLDDARDILNPFRERIFAAPLLTAVAAWHSFIRQQPALAMPIDETARANMIHCWWRNEVRRALAPTSSVREVEALGFFAIAVDTNPLVRFKCVSAGAPSNVETEQQRLLARHEYDDDAMVALALAGIPLPPTLLTCGYSLDVAAELKSAEIRCDYGRRLLWRWPIWGDEAEGGGVVEPMPLPDVPGPEPARVRSTRKQNREGYQEGQ
jgi:hypothetical protein